MRGVPRGRCAGLAIPTATQVERPGAIGRALAPVLAVLILAGCSGAPDGFVARGLSGYHYLQGSRHKLHGDMTAAVDAWTRAAAAGHVKAQYQLAHVHGSDLLGPRDQEAALALARRAAAAGYAPAAHYVGMSLLYGWGGIDRDPATAERYLRQAVADDVPRARADLGTLLLRRARDREGRPGAVAAGAEGWVLLEAAADDGEPLARLRLGEALLDEDHGRHDPDRAAVLLAEALDDGEIAAALPLARLMLTPGLGRPVDRAGAEALLDRIERQAPAHVLVDLGLALLDADAEPPLPGGVIRARRVLERGAEAGRARAHTALGKLLAEGRSGEMPPDPAAAVAHLRAAAEAGHGEATRAMGLLLRDQGRAGDALDWFVKAAAQGHAQAAVEAARLLVARGDPASVARAIALLRAEAEHHVPAAIDLARLARDGVPGVMAADPARARQWLRHAVEHGSGLAAAQAATDLARLLARGQGGAADPGAARALLERAAAGGHAWAALDLARLYERGAGAAMPPDPARAWRWYGVAASRDLAQAHTALGRMTVARGQGVGAIHRAFEHFSRAAAMGHDQALYEAGRVAEKGAAGLHGDPRAALAWYRRAAAQGVPAAHGAIASLYERGLGVPRDPVRALAFYRLGAEAGNAWAAYKVGRALAEGRGTMADPRAARPWLARARAEGVDQAVEVLARLDAAAVEAGTGGPLRIEVRPLGVGEP
ncbi:tetratricopeptide repeat protein [Roseospira visakhapatnamensis]|uniref:TPR repeat protein n=1 Tax=Roseospira visakhapatnamensis TaxID=390880 RepID=A0A7W6WAF2_9PROT|nr:SEL1-like repeat protein [Roseospira visakhapatnamensis]MBB4266432.1 TPR repeat protein [Roseospira visakhapatnamensis]